MADEGNTRRGVLAGTGLVGLAGFLAACGKSGGGASAGTPTAAGNNGAAAPATEDPGNATGDGGATEGTGGAKAKAKALAKTAAIPVGGGKIFKAKKIVVTQPKKGEFKAFTAVCPHAQCTVDKVAAGTIQCPCHGSKFKVTDGSRTAGPAKTGLAAKKIKISGGKIWLA
jgi:nitrite reductase/ring-hydroxylating ferredoxin subunit